jgi:predicted acyl esterase
MRDGVRLAADVYRPDADGRYPALLAYSPYGKTKQGLQPLPQPPASPLWDGGVEAGDPRFLTDNGYVHVIADVRGIGHSEGEYRGWMSKQEAEDGHDLVQWIAEQEWCDGNVGMVGISYFGTVQLHVAAEQPPALKAIMPWNAPADFYRECTHHGGILQFFFWELYMRSIRGRNVSVTHELYDDPAAYEALVRAAWEDPDLRMYTTQWNIVDNPESNPSYFDVMVNALDGPFYWERSARTLYDRIRIPYYCRSGWWAYAHMHLRGSFTHFAGIDAPGKVEIDVPVDEERPLPRRYDHEVLRWYDHWLKGKDTGVMDEPPLRLWTMGSDEWRFESEWPLARTQWTTFHLRARGGLSKEPETVPGRPDEFVQQPLDQTADVAKLRYETEPLASDLEVVGPLALTLYAAIDEDDTNWIVALKDVDGAGRDRELTRGYLKASHRELDPERSTPWEPFHTHLRRDPVPPGEVVEYAISLAPTCNVFWRGHRLALEIMALDHRRDPVAPPLVGPVHHPPHVCSSRTVRHTVFHDEQRPSALLVPVIPG